MAWVARRRALPLLTGIASFAGVVYYRENNNGADHRQDNAPNDSKRVLKTPVRDDVRLTLIFTEFDPIADSLWMASHVAGWNDRNIPRYSSAYLAKCAFPPSPLKKCLSQFSVKGLDFAV
jgi:hypothetical protein